MRCWPWTQHRWNRAGPAADSLRQEPLATDARVLVTQSHPAESDIQFPPDVPALFVSGEEWCDLHDRLADDNTLAWGTDLFRWADGPFRKNGLRGETLCSLWDPYQRRWALLSRADAATPFVERERLPKSHAAAPRRDT